MSRAQVTVPSEAEAVNSIFRRWNISATMSTYKWNTSNDICSDVSIEGTSEVGIYDKDTFNPGIICDCRHDGSACHVTRFKVYNMNIIGRFPEELVNLPYLNNLQIGRNYLSGPLPSFIGNFSHILYISIGLNAFSGEIPKELGNLVNLKSLGIGTNNFTGRLPSELGNITDLEQMYIDSMGVTGGIPSTFANFKKLKILWAGDNNFGGKLPDFIGNFTSLESLKFPGNSFLGPIPSSFGNLVNLKELWLDGLLNESSSLSFIGNMPRLYDLFLRNSKISGVIPLNMGNYMNLTYLDLSFNDLTGQLPQPLFNSSSLKYLYLGNNSFTGSLPATKSPQLLTIDLSYNNLSGSLPSWTGDPELELNLVANNFGANNDLPRHLDCLQRYIPCYRGSPVYHSFAINCGGNETVSADGTIYEADNKNFSSASYFVNDNIRWAVSSVGLYYESPNPQYTQYSSNSIFQTSNQDLFQTVRTSPSSLRYYGLALENGDYTISLDFAETGILDIQSWVSLGKRIFDIYIQGNLVAKDFDIRREAGGRSFTAITRNYTATVTENFLEIHFFWAGKGTCCIPIHSYYGPSISAINVLPNFKPTTSNHLPENKDKALIPGIAGGIAAALMLLFLAIFIWRWRRTTTGNKEEDLDGLAVKPNCISLAELKIATDDFNTANKLGEGGFGSVFKGKLSDGTLVAVKKLSASTLQGKKQFETEVGTISAVQHRNLVKLLGCCYEGSNRLLVYKYLQNNSLQYALFGNNSLHLDWPARFDICLGAARGLAYLHEESSVRIIHRDIKASNILLDASLKAKISDFGLAKFYDDKMTHVSTRVAGTLGYLAPEYAMRGILTEKADVYGFGIVVLETLSGRPNVGIGSDGLKTFILDWAWQLHEKKQELKILDPSLSSFNEIEAIRMIRVAFLCTQANPTLRPPMSRVVAMLVGSAEANDVTSRPSYLTEVYDDDSRASIITSQTVQTGTSSTSGSASTTKNQENSSNPLLSDSFFTHSHAR